MVWDILVARPYYLKFPWTKIFKTTNVVVSNTVHRTKCWAIMFDAHPSVHNVCEIFTWHTIGWWRSHLFRLTDKIRVVCYANRTVLDKKIIGSRIPFEDCVELSDFNVSMNFMLRCSSMIKCVNISNNIEIKFFVLQRQSLPRLWLTQQANGK